MPHKFLFTLIALSGLIFAGCQSHSSQVAEIIARNDVTPAPTPDFGDAALAFTSAGWIQGGPANITEPGKVFVIFGPGLSDAHTKKSVSHLQALYQTQSDQVVVFIGHQSFPDDEEFRRSMIESLGRRKITFAVAEFKNQDEHWENRDFYHYPRTFIIKNNTVVWAGHAGALTDKLLKAIRDGSYDAAWADSEKSAERIRYNRLNQLRLLIKNETDSGNWNAALDIAEKFIAALPENERFVAETAYGIAMSGMEFDRFKMTRFQQELKRIERDIDENYPGMALERLERLQKSPWFEDEPMLQIFTPAILAQVSGEKMREYLRKKFLGKNEAAGTPEFSLFVIMMLFQHHRTPDDMQLGRELVAAAKSRGADKDTVAYYSAVIDLLECKQSAKASVAKLAEFAKNASVKKSATELLQQIQEAEAKGVPLLQK